MAADDEQAGGPGGRRRPALLAGGLVGLAGTLDVLTYLSLRSTEPFVDVTDGRVSVLHTTGWSRLHVGLGLLVVLTALVIATGRTRLVSVGLGVVAVAATVDVLFMPYDPWHGLVAVGLHASAAVILVRNWRVLLAPAGPSGAGVSGPGRPDR
ncbi:hypothetical protein MRQ36_21490 [Micromonospora sp. R77]|uniref:DUF7144 family membrane protein n=1 Tax=Micromonospora sp. R77 TaxID=2925836 RepID=UPI001F6104CD|nr:hypothetical protein [Micromonospora sp. R77]MCI4065000.1 hypothetical protein [Micromonospora sp. R77]